MPYHVEFTLAARNALAELPRKHQRQIISKIDSLARDPRPRNARPLEGYPDLWRIQSGDYRIIYTVQNEVLVVVIVKIGHRKSVYRRLGDL